MRIKLLTQSYTKRIKRLTFVFILLLILSSPIGVLVRVSLFENVKIYPQDVIAGLVLISILIYIVINLNKFKKNNLLKSIVIFNIIALFSLIVNLINLTSEQLIVSALYLVRLDSYLSLLFIGSIGFSLFQKKLLRKIFVLASASIVIAGFTQYFFYNNLRNLYYLGWDEHLYRMFSTFLDPNYAGLIFALFSVVLLGLVLIYSQKGGYKLKLLYYISFLLIFVAMLLTYSRTAVLAFVFGGSFLLISLRRLKAFIILVVVMLISVFLVSDVSIEGLNPLRIASSEARISSMKEGLSIFIDKPILGVGFNAYRYAQIERGFRNIESSILSNADAGTDNSFIFILATAGIVGLVSYLFVWLQIVFKIISSRTKIKKIIAFSVIVSLFVGSQFINALFYMPIMLWVFTYLGLFVFTSRED